MENQEKILSAKTFNVCNGFGYGLFYLPVLSAYEPSSDKPSEIFCWIQNLLDQDREASYETAYQKNWVK